MFTPLEQLFWVSNMKNSEFITHFVLVAKLAHQSGGQICPPARTEFVPTLNLLIIVHKRMHNILI